MPLTAENFMGFQVESVVSTLKSFQPKMATRGEGYFNQGRVYELACGIPGHFYSARVRGHGGNYEVSLQAGPGAGKWRDSCTCSLGCNCKHAYAALKQLMAEQAQAAVGLLSAGETPAAPPAAPRPRLTGFAATVQEKLDRPLTHGEIQYLKNITKLFHKAVNGGLYFYHELTGLGLAQNSYYWNRLELYPAPPKSEEEFWNYLALYLTEKAGQELSAFLAPATDLAAARTGLRQMQRGREIERWRGQLANFFGETGENGAAPEAGPAPELRLRFGAKELDLEWRQPGSQEWKELKPRKLNYFEQRHSAQLSTEAALLWLPCWQHASMQYVSSFSYTDFWVVEQAGRWLRQPLVRPLLVNELGEPLVFHDAPLRWQITEPAGADGDYAVALVQADGQPAPAVHLATKGHPVFYVTAQGVFTGPPADSNLPLSAKETLIPARALETAGGLRLLEYLRVPTPARLAARIRTVKLQPWVRAEVKAAWTGGTTEYCFLEVLGASEDGLLVEHWTGQSWSPLQGRVRTKADDFLRLDRTALGGLVPPLEQAGFKWDYNTGRWQLRVTKKFPLAFVPFLQALPAGTRIDLGGELATFQNAQVAGKIRLEASEAGLDWFDLRVIVDVNDTTLTPEEVKLLLDARGQWVRLGQKGWRKLEFTLSEEEDRELARLGLTPHELTSEPQRLHAFQLADRAARKFLPEETCAQIERRAAELQTRVTPEVPAVIEASLRPYQRDGFHFLAYLSTNHFGGILADDMGLGKTLQTLVWLAWLRHGGEAAPAAGGAVLPSLVVCPKSVADNWQAEAAKFFPQLKVRLWRASELKSFASEQASADLHVLNYSQLRGLAREVVKLRFQAVILDEGQYIKNPSSQTAQVARQLQAGHRLILSGTPIENRLLDLWSLMSFAMPGALGNRTEFGRLYDAKSDPLARQRLSARVRPFLIRRTKAQVAGDLPDRIEKDLLCELEGEQKALYRAELKRAQAMLLGVKTAAALNKERFNFLTSLLRLRQICCHPRLVKATSTAGSAKVESLMDTLEPLIEEGEKVLVFSQFVGLLDLLREEIQTRGWQHWYLAGETEDRGALVAEFQSAPGPGVFLISLKAGGFGLNLTAASYVVLFDPWWNPAVENQAIDRTHRIGQDRTVIAYRLLIKDSIEEKIRTLQKQKSALANDVLGEEKFSQGLSLDDLRYLLTE